MVFVRPVLLLALAGLGASWSVGAAAQQVYRIMGPDGRVTFSDRPPPEAKATPAPTVQMPGPAAAGGSLPFELRNVAGRYPVTLYTGTDCAPCSSGRSFLARRGVPFNERTISSPDDITALQRLSGDARLPFLTIGGQQLHGFSESEWTQFLDAAGYPKTSQLPSSYRNPAPAPLVAVQRAPEAPAQAASEAAPQAQTRPAPPPPAAPPNPAGIRF